MLRTVGVIRTFSWIILTPLSDSGAASTRNVEVIAAGGAPIPTMPGSGKLFAANAPLGGLCKVTIRWLMHIDQSGRNSAAGWRFGPGAWPYVSRGAFAGQKYRASLRTARHDLV
jgi:hypothetical protein